MLGAFKTFGQETFSRVYQFDEDAVTEGFVLFEDEGSYYVSCSEVCNLPEGGFCSRFLKFELDNDNLDWQENTVYSPDSALLYSRCYIEFFVSSPTEDSFYYLASANRKGALWKLDSNLDTLSTKIYASDTSHIYKSLITTTDGFVVMCGNAEIEFLNVVPFIHKVDSEGNTLWKNYYGTTTWDGLSTILEDSDGGYLLGGRTNFAAPESTGESEGYLFKVDANGEVLWDLVVEGFPLDEHPTGETLSPFGGKDGPLHVKLHPEGGYLLWQNVATYDNVNASVQIIPDDSTPRILRISSDGEILWDYRHFDGDQYNKRLNSLVLFPDGSIVGCGHSNSLPNLARRNAWMMHLDSAGEFQWQRTYVHPHNYDDDEDVQSWFRDLLIIEENKILLTGLAYAGPDELPKLWMFLTDKDGCLVPECDDEIVYAEFPIGIEDDLDPPQVLNLRPNPSRGSFYIDSESDLRIQNVFDSSGRTVQFDLEENRLSLPSKGTYIVVFEHPDGKRVSKKLIVY